MLLSVGMHNKLESHKNTISLVNLKKITQNASVYMSNEINQIYFQKDFAFSYQWSGEAYNRFVHTGKFRFLINRDLSYVSTDLIAQVKNTSSAACVGNYLASKEFLSAFQVKTKYFSPYTNLDTVPQGQFRQMYEKFIKSLPMLRWLEPASAARLKKLEQEWNVVKYELSKNSK
ncbi:MAG: hypothetical protein P4M14_11335 [Gammaproteobacteria bacterium]|nr:hypothetical protein [Gammaproteobacteria bacterium]